MVVTGERSVSFVSVFRLSDRERLTSNRRMEEGKEQGTKGPKLFPPFPSLAALAFVVA